MHFRLSYLSEAVGRIALPDVRALASDAAITNARLDVTGALCLVDGFFIQVLEGERGAVSALFARIAQDPRHTGVELLSAGFAPRRHFASWAMKLVRFDGGSPATQMYRRIAGDGPFQPALWTGELALLVLDTACHAAPTSAHRTVAA